MARITLTLDGPDAVQALAELRANVQYDRLDVTVTERPDPHTLAACVSELAIALRDTLQGYVPSELSSPPPDLYRRAVAGLDAAGWFHSPAERASLEATLDTGTWLTVPDQGAEALAALRDALRDALNALDGDRITTETFIDCVSTYAGAQR